MIDNAIKDKRSLWKEWKAGGSKERHGRKFMLLRSGDYRIF